MHIFSTLFTAESVDKALSTEEGRREAVRWCRETGITKVYVESFRGLFIEQKILEELRDYFEAEGFEVDGCVTTVKLPKSAINYELVGCYAYQPNHELIEEIFRRTAAVFETIMIDDFLFTACDCEDCKKAAAGRSLERYHSDVMFEMSIDRILKPAKEVNPNCKVIIKYPNWYDAFYSRGYDVVRETEAFDLIWAGNETRDPDSKQWGCYPQTMACYMMAWDMKLDDAKCMGGWYDAYACQQATYLEQARNTILGGARESMLFCYRLLSEEEVGINAVKALRPEQEGLHKLAYLIADKKIVGVSVPKKPNCDAEKERYIAGMYGMLGIPFSAETELDPCAKSVILGEQTTGYPDVRSYAKEMIHAGKPVAFTDEFFAFTNFDKAEDAIVFSPKGDNWNLMDIPQKDLDTLRNRLLAPYGVSLNAKSRVGLSLFDDDMEILQNFNDEAVEVQIDLKGRNKKVRNIVLVLSQNKKVVMNREGTSYALTIPARTLVVLY